MLVVAVAIKTKTRVNEGEDSSIAAIAGGVMGTWVLIAAVAALLYFYNFYANRSRGEEAAPAATK